jgi:transposase-like protein
MSEESRHRWSEADARRALARGQRQNLSIAALARRLGVSAQRLYWWRAALRRRDGAARPKFVEITPAVSASMAPGRRSFSVETPAGYVIEVPAGFDAGDLARLLALVEGREC